MKPITFEVLQMNEWLSILYRYISVESYHRYITLQNITTPSSTQYPQTRPFQS